MRGIALLVIVAGLGCESTRTTITTEEAHASLPRSSFVTLPKLADDLDLDYHGEREGYIELSAFPDHVMLVRDSRRALVNRREVSMDDPCILRGEEFVLTAADAEKVILTLETLRSERTPPPPFVTPPPRVRPEPEAVHLPAAWRPRAPLRAWRYIVVHHMAAPRGSAAVIHRMHIQRKFDGLGYHFVIGNGTLTGNGEVEVGYRWIRQVHGAHARARPRDPSDDNRWNLHGIGICLVGHFEQDPPSQRQMDALVRLVRTLQAEYGIPAGNVVPHRVVSNTKCPGRLFPWDDFKRRLRR